MQVTVHECAVHMCGWRFLGERKSQVRKLHCTLAKHSSASRHGLRLHLGSSPQERGASIYLTVGCGLMFMVPQNHQSLHVSTQVAQIYLRLKKKKIQNNNTTLETSGRKGLSHPLSRECWVYRPAPCTAARASPSEEPYLSGW